MAACTTYKDICQQYTNYVTRHYGYAIIVFDGYLDDELSTKDSAHQHRTGGRTLTVDFISDMVMKSKKEEFLSNKTSKQKFIMLLSDCLDQAGCETHQALGDADVLVMTSSLNLRKGEEQSSVLLEVNMEQFAWYGVGADNFTETIWGCSEHDLYYY